MRSAAVSPRRAFIALGDSWGLQLSGTCELWPKLTVEEAPDPRSVRWSPLRASLVQRHHSHRGKRYSRSAGFEAAWRYRRFRAARIAAPMTAAVQDPKSTAILTLSSVLVPAP